MIQTNDKYKKFFQNFPGHKLYIVFPREEFRQFVTCFFVINGWYVSFGHDDNIVSVGKQIFVASKKFPDQPFDFISFYSVSRFFRYSDSESFNTIRIDVCYGRKMFGTSPHPLIINYFKPAFVRYPFCFPVRLFFHA